MATAQYPKYEQVKRALILEIEEGRLPPGSAIPSEAELLRRFKVSRPTLIRSFQELVREGWVYRKQGKGTFVADRSAMSNGLEGVGEAKTVELFVHADAARQIGDSKEALIHLVRGIQSVLESADFSLTFRAVPDFEKGEIDEFLGDRPPAAALVIEPSFSPVLWQQLLARRWNTWAILDHVPDGNCVYIDQEHAGYLATSYLLDKGCRDVVLLNGPLSAYWGFGARLAGYRRALAERKISFRPEFALEGAHVVDSEAGRAMMRSVIEAGFDFDGVVGVSDGKTIGAMMAAEEAGRRIGQDLQFISIDNTVAEYAPHPLSSVTMAFEEAGRLAASLAVSTLFDKQSIPVVTHCKLVPTLIVRQ